MRLVRLIPTFLILCLAAQSLSGQDSVGFRPDDPLGKDPDDLPIPMPKEDEIPQIYDFLENTFVRRPADDEPIPPSLNVNTLGEVPDSSWFTNRISRRLPTLDELRRGPDRLDGPDMSTPWSIIAAKTQGITPGFTIRDGRGDVYFVKFDPRAHPQLATSTEVIVTKFFHAFGYNVPENYLVFIRPDDLVISPDARLTDQEGKQRSFTQGDLDRIFRRIYQGSDGTTPVLASLRLPGRPLGPFKYYGTRSDDPNDIFPHQHRRELRGLRLLSAWLNHDDSRSVNTLDMYIGDPGQGHVRHHLIDFGSCLGSGSVKVQSRRAGNEYILEWGPILKSAATFGIWDRAWRYVDYPDYPSVGRFEGDFFQPELWRPEYPNPAFERMLSEDAFWAVRIIRRFSDEMVRSLVETGRLWEPESEEYLVRTLIKRRDKIIHHYLPRIAAFDEFHLRAGANDASLEFTDLLVESGLASSTSYSGRWHAFDNFTQESEPLGSAFSVQRPVVPLPDDNSPFLMLELRRTDSPFPARVFVRQEGGTRTVVGIERTGEE